MTFNCTDKIKIYRVVKNVSCCTRIGISKARQ